MKFKIFAKRYIVPSPAGAYYCVATREAATDAHRLLQFLLQQKETPRFSPESLAESLDMTVDELSELVYDCQRRGWLGGLDQPRQLPQGQLEEILPDLLKRLSDQQQAILADSQGFYISAQGVSEEIAVEVSALSADIASMHDRHQGLLQHKLALSTSAWSLVDAAGNSQFGFWPMFMGDQRFVLVIGGLPQMNRMQLTNLIWALYHRYGC